MSGKSSTYHAALKSSCIFVDAHFTCSCVARSFCEEQKPYSIRTCKHEMRIMARKHIYVRVCVNSLKQNQLQTNFVFGVRTSLAF